MCNNISMGNAIDGAPQTAVDALLFNYKNLPILDVDREVARRAAQLRAEFNLRPADALQVAVCIVGNAQVFIANDKQLNRLEPIKVAIIDDLI